MFTFAEYVDCRICFCLALVPPSWEGGTFFLRGKGLSI